MNCPTCKNPITNSATNCEWCGSLLSVNDPIKIDFNEFKFTELCLKNKIEAFDYYSQFYSCEPKDIEKIINYLAEPKKRNYFSDRSIEVLRIKHQKFRKI